MLRLHLLVAANTAVLLGCGPTSTRPPTHPTSGHVLRDDKPVENAIITFRPVDGQHPANGVTDASGRYKLTTFSKGDGAMAGQYRVVIVKYPQRQQSPDATAVEEYVPVMGPTPQPRNLLPEKYASADHSELTADIRPKEKNNFDFTID